MGQTLNISCKISGKPTPEVAWYKDRTELQDTDRVHIDSSGDSTSLVVTNATELDAGRYSLCLENDCGRDTFAISVSIVGKKNIFNRPPQNVKMKISYELVYILG